MCVYVDMIFKIYKLIPKFRLMRKNGISTGKMLGSESPCLKCMEVWTPVGYKGKFCGSMGWEAESNGK